MELSAGELSILQHAVIAKTLEVALSPNVQSILVLSQVSTLTSLTPRTADLLLLLFSGKTGELLFLLLRCSIMKRLPGLCEVWRSRIKKKRKRKAQLLFSAAMALLHTTLGSPEQFVRR